MFTSHRLPLLGKGDLLSSSVGVSKRWILLAEALSGKETSGQGGNAAKDESEVETTSTACRGRFNSRQIVFELLKLPLGLFELLLKRSRSQSRRHQQHNSMQKPHRAVT